MEQNDLLTMLLPDRRKVDLGTYQKDLVLIIKKEKMLKYFIPLAMIIAGIAASIVFPVTHPLALFGILTTTGLALLIKHEMLFRVLRRFWHRDIALAYAATPMLVVDIVNDKVISGVGGALFVSGIIYTFGVISHSEALVTVGYVGIATIVFSLTYRNSNIYWWREDVVLLERFYDHLFKRIRKDVLPDGTLRGHVVNHELHTSIGAMAANLSGFIAHYESPLSIFRAIMENTPLRNEDFNIQVFTDANVMEPDETVFRLLCAAYGYDASKGSASEIFTAFDLASHPVPGYAAWYTEKLNGETVRVF